MPGGKKREIAEYNDSAFIPSIEWGADLPRAKLITTAMLVEATQALASQARAMKDLDAVLLPDVEDVGEVSVKIAAAVIKQAIKEGVAQDAGLPGTDEELEEWIRMDVDCRVQAAWDSVVDAQTSCSVAFHLSCSKVC